MLRRPHERIPSARSHGSRVRSRFGGVYSQCDGAFLVVEKLPDFARPNTMTTDLRQGRSRIRDRLRYDFNELRIVLPAATPARWCSAIFCIAYRDLDSLPVVSLTPLRWLLVDGNLSLAHEGNEKRLASKASMSAKLALSSR